MFNLAGKSLDFDALLRAGTSQGNDMIVSVAERAPDFVKTAAVIEDDQAEQLSDNHFALILQYKRQEHGIEKTAQQRLFPIPSKAYTWLQIEALQRTGEQLPDEARKVASYHISNAARRYGIEVPEAIAQDAEGMQSFNNRVDATALTDPSVKVASAQEQEGYDDDANWGWVHGDDKRFPLHTPVLVKKAMDYVERHELTFMPRDRHSFCAKVVDKAREMKVDVTEKVASYGGRYYHGSADAMVKLRHLHTESDQERETLTKIANLKDAIDPREFAAILDEFDTATKMAQRGKVPDAFSSTLSEMGPLDGFSDREIAGGVVNNQKKLGSYLGKGLVRQLAEDPRGTYTALDDEQKDVFHQILSGAM